MSEPSTRPDPPMKRVNREFVCALASCGKPLGPVAIANDDPFHSVECCRIYHETPASFGSVS